MESLFSERVKLIRLNRGLTQEDVAMALGIGKSTFCQYEKGTRKPDLPTIIKISEFLGTSADYLLGITDDSNGNVKTIKGKTSQQLSALIRDFFSDINIPQSSKDNMFKDINAMYWKYKK